MIIDILLILLVVFVGGLLGLVAEFLKYLYPVCLAMLLLIAAGLLTLVERLIKFTAKQEP